jgi:hypothetical protein
MDSRGCPGGRPDDAVTIPAVTLVPDTRAVNAGQLPRVGRIDRVPGLEQRRIGRPTATRKH